MDPLHYHRGIIGDARRALDRAEITNDLNDCLRCLHNARQMIDEAWKGIVEWREGAVGAQRAVPVTEPDKVNDRQDACPTEINT